MPEPVNENKSLEAKNEEIKKDEFVYARDHKKSLREISIESANRQRLIREEESKKQEEKPKEQVETKKEEVKQEEKKEEVKTPTAEEVLAKAKEEAKKVAEETAQAEFKKKTEEILNQNKSIEEKQKEQDELIDVWTKENRLPKNYKEVVDETLRLSEAKFKQLEKKKAEDIQKKENEQKKLDQVTKEQQEMIQKARLEEINKNVSIGLDNLYERKHIKKPSDPKEIENEKTTDEGAIQTRNLLIYGIKLNKERAEKKLPPVASITDLYFMFYKPEMDAKNKKQNDNQPAGADAPISGAKSTPSRETSSQKYVYARDHNKTYRQILQEELRKQTKS